MKKMRWGRYAAVAAILAACTAYAGDWDDRHSKGWHDDDRGGRHSKGWHDGDRDGRHSKGRHDDDRDGRHSKKWRGSAEFARLVRRETARFLDVDVAVAEGYAVLLGCVSGRDSGAMGIHYLNAGLVGDGILDPAQPEVLIYEPRSRGRMRLVGVEYLTFAEVWHTGSEAPPVLEGQVFHYTGAPNRYATPAHYELHVWAWRSNPNGTFADWNPRVSCDEYDPS